MAKKRRGSRQQQQSLLLDETEEEELERRRKLIKRGDFPKRLSGTRWIGCTPPINEDSDSD